MVQLPVSLGMAREFRRLIAPRFRTALRSRVLSGSAVCVLRVPLRGSCLGTALSGHGTTSLQAGSSPANHATNFSALATSVSDLSHHISRPHASTARAGRAHRRRAASCLPASPPHWPTPARPEAEEQSDGRVSASAPPMPSPVPSIMLRVSLPTGGEPPVRLSSHGGGRELA